MRKLVLALDLGSERNESEKSASGGWQYLLRRVLALCKDMVCQYDVVIEVIQHSLTHSLTYSQLSHLHSGRNRSFRSSRDTALPALLCDTHDIDA